jgi:hypothetical protein
MNGRMSKLLRRWAVGKNLSYRMIKRRWIKLAHANRGSVARQMRERLAL